MPSNKEVLLCFIATKQKIMETNGDTKTSTNYEAKLQLFFKLKIENNKASFPTQSKRGFFAKLEKLLNTYEKERKNTLKFQLLEQVLRRSPSYAGLKHYFFVFLCFILSFCLFSRKIQFNQTFLLG